jgi:hypothetical protein
MVNGTNDFTMSLTRAGIDGLKDIVCDVAVRGIEIRITYILRANEKFCGAMHKISKVLEPTKYVGGKLFDKETKRYTIMVIVDRDISMAAPSVEQQVRKFTDLLLETIQTEFSARRNLSLAKASPSPATVGTDTHHSREGRRFPRGMVHIS